MDEKVFRRERLLASGLLRGLDQVEAGFFMTEAAAQPVRLEAGEPAAPCQPVPALPQPQRSPRLGP
jgi:hypothetical protein